MRKVILLLGLVLQVIIVDAQSVSGSLADEKGNPAARLDCKRYDSAGAFTACRRVQTGKIMVCFAALHLRGIR